MEFTIKDQFADLRETNLVIARTEAAAGNPFAVLQVAQILVNRFDQDTRVGLKRAGDLLSSTDWRAHPITTAAYAFFVEFCSGKSRKERDRSVRKIITPSFISELVTHADESYYSRLFASMFILRGYKSQRELLSPSEFFEARALLEPLVRPKITKLEDTFLPGDAVALSEFHALLTSMAFGIGGLSSDEKAVLFEEASLSLLAAARGGNLHAQENVGQKIISPDGRYSFLTTVPDWNARLKIAEECLEAAVKQGSLAARLFLARVYRATDRYAEALPLYIGSPDKRLDEVVDVLKKIGDVDGVKRLYRHFSQKGGEGEKIALLGLADYHHDLGEFAEAEAVYAKLLQRKEVGPHEVQALVRLIDYHSGEPKDGITQDLNRATLLCERAVAYRPLSAGQFSAVDKACISATRKSLRDRAVIVGPEGLRRLQPADKIMAPKVRFAILPNDPNEFVAAVPPAARALNSLISMEFASEMAARTAQTTQAVYWRNIAAKQGSPPHMRDAILSFYLGEPDQPKQLVMAWNLVRMALRDPKEHGVAHGAIRAEIEAIRGALLGQPDGEPARIWFPETDGRLRPITDKDNMVSRALEVPQEKDEAILWFLKAAGEGSLEAVRAVAWLYMQDPELSDKVHVWEDDGSLRPARQGDDLSKAVVGFLPSVPEPKTESVTPMSESEATASVETDIGHVEVSNDLEAGPDFKCAEGYSTGGSFKAALAFYEQGQDDEAFAVYSELLEQGLNTGLEVAEHLAGVREGGVPETSLAHNLWIQLTEQREELKREGGDDIDNRLSVLRDKILMDAWIIDDKALLRKVQNSVEPDVEIKDNQDLLFFPDTPQGLHSLSLEKDKSFDAAIEVTRRLVVGGPGRSADWPTAFRELSDLLLDRNKVPQQFPNSIGPLPPDLPKRADVQRLWNVLCLGLVSADLDEHGREEFCMPDAVKSSSFFIESAAVAEFRKLIADGRVDGFRARQKGYSVAHCLG